VKGVFSGGCFFRTPRVAGPSQLYLRMMGARSLRKKNLKENAFENRSA